MSRRLAGPRGSRVPVGTAERGADEPAARPWFMVSMRSLNGWLNAQRSAKHFLECCALRVER